MSTSTPRHVSIVGPTAVGKSRLALELARRFPDVEIVSVDSMQVYRGMDIGTAKPTVRERAEVPHHVIDIVDPTDEFTLTQFQAAAREAIGDIEARNKRALLVGGTGLYLQAITDGFDIPGQYPEVRIDLDAEERTEMLYERLRELDPVAASRMEPTNRRRVVRALEVTLGAKRPFSSFGPGLDHYPDVPFALVGLWMSREVNAIHIKKRVDEMFAAGWIDEVRELTKTQSLSKTAAQALGYKELIDVLRGSTTESDARQRIIDRTRSFARRQRMWFRRDPRIRWFGTSDDVDSLVAAVLRDCELGFNLSRLEGGDRS